MKDPAQRFLSAAVLFAMAIFVRQATGQTSAPAIREPLADAQPSATPAATTSAKNSLDALLPAVASQPLFDFKDSDIKFRLPTLMSVLRDRDHEGWVLAAYPDPKTGRPLIGAGFSLDVEATDHSQLDPLNPHLFLEPSSAQLWQAAGLEPGRLRRILDQFDRNLEAWTKKGYRRKIRANTLTPELTEAEATSLLRISAIQAIHNARAYCRNFDQLSASQQMALSQLVFQMGVNLEEFVDFLAAINGDVTAPNASSSMASDESVPEHWDTVQQTLIDSQWARRYTTRASTVIAMFDANYARDPAGAERRVAAVLHPQTKHHRKRAANESLRAANDGGHSGKKGSQSKRKLT